MKGGLPAVLRVGLLLSAVLAALTMVVWRDTRAREGLSELEASRREANLLEARRVELRGRIEELDSRRRIVTEAGWRLGMRTPRGDEMRLLPAPVAPGGSLAEVDTAVARRPDLLGRVGGRWW